jgi:hypothetical protein
MSTVPYDSAITGHLQTSAELIVLKQSAEEQTAWVRFLLTELEPLLPKQTYTDLLTDIHEQIAARLAGGHW